MKCYCGGWARVERTPLHGGMASCSASCSACGFTSSWLELPPKPILVAEKTRGRPTRKETPHDGNY